MVMSCLLETNSLCAKKIVISIFAFKRARTAHLLVFDLDNRILFPLHCIDIRQLMGYSLDYPFYVNIEIVR